MSFQIKKITISEKQQVLALYDSLKGSYGCTWSQDYPNMEDVENDIQSQSLYGVYDNQILIAAAAAAADDELVDLDCWDGNIKKPCELARIGVKKEYQNRGIAKLLLIHVEHDIPKRGLDGIHFLVSKTNPYAIKLYDSLGYSCCGETFMYDTDWFCYEKYLPSTPDPSKYPPAGNDSTV